jgi:hypothetical protein
MCDILLVGGGCSDVMGVLKALSFVIPCRSIGDVGPCPLYDSGSVPAQRSVPNMSTLFLFFGTKVKVPPQMFPEIMLCSEMLD